MNSGIHSQKKTYLVITPFFPSDDSFRGPYIYDQVKALIRNSDYNLIVYKSVSYSEYNCNNRAYTYCGIIVNLFPELRTPSYFFNGFFNEFNANHLKKRLLKDGVNFNDISVVHCHTSEYGIYGLKIKEINSSVKVILQHHDKDPFCIRNGMFAGWKPNTLYRAKKSLDVFARIDLHVCVSQAVKDNLVSFPQPGPNEVYQPYINRLKNVSSLKSDVVYNAIVLYNGVDLEKFHPESTNKNDTFTIGCIGNFVDLKRQADLIKAAYILKTEYNFVDFKIKFIGSGPTLNNCIDLCKALHLEDNCIFISETDHKNLIKFYNSINLFVLPSVYEGFGCVYTESAACKVPYMVPINQGASEYLLREESRYWTFPPGNYHQLATIIKDFYDHPTRIQHYSFPLDINELIKTFINYIDSLWH